MAIDSENPFGFDYSKSSQNFWAAAQTPVTNSGGSYGGSQTNNGLNCGNFNTADNWGTNGQKSGTNSSPYNGGGSQSWGATGYDSNGSYSGSNTAPHPSPGIGNNGGGEGTDLLGDVTVINTAVGLNPTFVADNIFQGMGSIGLYGRSRGIGTQARNPNTPPFPSPPDPTKGVPPTQQMDTANDWSIGVLGQSSKGCGVYGLATDDNPTATPPPGQPTQPSHGIGVVGRSVGGLALENMSVEQAMGWVENPKDVFDSAIGVLGQSLNGPGVRGHGGPLLRLTFTKTSAPGKGTGGTSGLIPLPPTESSSSAWLVANPGGVFSSGRRQYIEIGGNDLLFQEMSPDSFAQLRLVPSVGTHLPGSAKVGDMFLQLPNPGGGTGPNGEVISPIANLWICTGYEGSAVGGVGVPVTTTPKWQQVLLGPPQPGGTAPTAYQVPNSVLTPEST